VEVLGIALFVLFLVIGLLMVPLGLPGTVVIALDALVFSWATGWEKIAPWMVGVLVLMAVVSEVADNVLTVAGAKKHGTSKGGQWAAFIGGIAGAVLLGGLLTPVLGLIGLAGGPVGGLVGALIGPVLGAFVGCFAGVWAAESAQRRSQGEAVKAAWGAILGRAMGVALKLALSAAMIVTCLTAVF